MRRIRLVAIQGSSQLLNALAVLRMEALESPSTLYDDYLLIHGVHADRETCSIFDATISLSRIWSWKRVFVLSEHEDELARLKNVNPAHCYKRLIEILDLARIDVLVANRNWQITNEIILGTYRDAHKVLCGDGFGFADSRMAAEYVPFDEARLVLPVEKEYGLLDSLPYGVVHKECLQWAISAYVSATPELVEELADYAFDDFTLLLPQNLVEAGFFTEEEEISYYVAHVRQFSAGHRVVIKPHPRQTNMRLKRLCHALEVQLGVQVDTIDGSFISSLPIEVVLFLLKPKQVIAPCSSSCVSIKHLYRIEAVPLLIPETLRSMSVQYRQHFISAAMMYVDILYNLDAWDGASILSKSSEIDALVTIGAMLEAGRFEQVLQLIASFRSPRLSSSICNALAYYEAAASYELNLTHASKGKLLELLSRAPNHEPARRLLEVLTSGKTKRNDRPTMLEVLSGRYFSLAGQGTIGPAPSVGRTPKGQPSELPLATLRSSLEPAPIFADIQVLEGLRRQAADAMNQADFPRARYLSERVVQASSHLIDSHFLLSDVLMGQDAYGEALQALEAYLHTQVPSLLKRLGVSRHHLGDTLGARKALEQSLELAPADVDLLVSLGDLCIGEKDFSQAYDYFTRALEYAPTDIDAAIGQIYAGNGLKEESLTQRALQRLSELDPSHPLLADAAQKFA